MRIRMLGVAFVAAMICVPVVAEDATALKQKEEAIEKRVAQLQDELFNARKQLLEEPDLAEARKRAEEARQAYYQKLRSSREVNSAKQAADAADRAERKVIDAEMKGDQEALGLEKEYEATDRKIAALDEQRKAAQGALGQIRARVRNGPAMQQAAQGQKEADEAVLNLPRTDAKLVAAGRAVEEARKALEARIKTLPEKQALDEATRSYEHLLEVSPELAAARKKRDEARRGFEEKLSAEVAADGEGAARLAELGKIQSQIHDARVNAQGIETKLSAQRRKLALGSPRAVEARAAADAAHGAYRRAVEEQTRGEKEAASRAEEALNRTMDARIAADPKLAAAMKEIQELDAQLRALRDQIRKSRVAAPAQSPAAR